MRFVQRDGGRLLIDEAAPVGASGFAVLRTDNEVLAMRGFCRLYLLSGTESRSNSQSGSGEQYRVTPLGASGEKLSLLIRGSGRPYRPPKFMIPAHGDAADPGKART